jgi:hypothetical protein
MNTETIIALLGVGGGGTIILTLLTGWLKRGDRTMDEAAEIRKELRAQNTAILLRLDTVEKDLDLWKLKYYALQQSYTTLLIEKESLTQKSVTMQAEIDALRKEVDALRVHRAKAEKPALKGE